MREAAEGHLIHGMVLGKALAMEDIPCNAYCRPEDGVHCDLVYTRPGTTESELRFSSQLHLVTTAEVLEVRPASEEAPPPDDRYFPDTIWGPRPEKVEPWLVFWRRK